MPKKTATADWTRKQILVALEGAGYPTVRSLAEKCKVATSTIFLAFAKPYPACEKRIADAIGVHPKEIWPSRYDAEGIPNRLPIGHARRMTVGKSLRHSARQAT